LFGGHLELKGRSVFRERSIEKTCRGRIGKSSFPTAGVLRGVWAEKEVNGDTVRGGCNEFVRGKRSALRKTVRLTGWKLERPGVSRLPSGKIAHLRLVCLFFAKDGPRIVEKKGKVSKAFGSPECRKRRQREIGMAVSLKVYA